ncbi:MAG: gas vesicle protein K [Deltaproteobacteria bacterium]|nr:gas vesicle protein K [Deltaproteobacteria bacterium]
MLAERKLTEREVQNPWPPLSAPANGRQAARLNLEAEKVEQGLAKLVLSLIELIRQLLERQAIHRMDAGSLSPEEAERLGTTLMKLEKRMQELKEHFGIDDLNLDLGPLGKLID